MSRNTNEGKSIGAVGIDLSNNSDVGVQICVLLDKDGNEILTTVLNADGMFL